MRVVTDVLRDIDSLADDYMKNVKGLTADSRKEQLTKIQKLFSKTREYGDDKVQLAMQTYEMASQINCLSKCLYIFSYRVFCVSFLAKNSCHL